MLSSEGEMRGGWGGGWGGGEGGGGVAANLKHSNDHKDH